MKIAVAKGDGIGPEIMEAVIGVFNAAKVPLEYKFVDMGKWVFDKGFSNGMTPEAKDTIEQLKVKFGYAMSEPNGFWEKPVLNPQIIDRPSQLFGATIIPVPILH